MNLPNPQLGNWKRSVHKRAQLLWKWEECGAKARWCRCRYTVLSHDVAKGWTQVWRVTDSSTRCWQYSSAAVEEVEDEHLITAGACFKNLLWSLSMSCQPRHILILSVYIKADLRAAGLMQRMYTSCYVSTNFVSCVLQYVSTINSRAVAVSFLPGLEFDVYKNTSWFSVLFMPQQLLGWLASNYLHAITLIILSCQQLHLLMPPHKTFFTLHSHQIKTDNCAGNVVKLMIVSQTLRFHIALRD